LTTRHVNDREVAIQRARRIINGLKAYREALLTCSLTLEPDERNSIRERYSHDKAVIALCCDVERLIKAIAAPLDVISAPSSPAGSKCCPAPGTFPDQEWG
jgi:hypothetical protein